MLQTLLNTTIEVCRNVNLGDSLPSMLDTVFFIWIHTKRNTPQMWKAFQDGVSSVLHVKEPIRQTKVTTIPVYTMEILSNNLNVAVEINIDFLFFI